jgi:FkbM family methyltransferase
MGARIEARSIARRVGLKRTLQQLQRRLPGHDRYEAKVKAALEGAVRDGDTVWDIGANVGLYTQMFSEWVGPGGHVVAFEPVPSCYTTLQRATRNCGNVEALNLGLSDVDAVLPMHLSGDEAGTMHTFVAERGAGAEVIELPVHRGDALLGERDLPSPNVLKIDVEGFELEALRGLAETLASATCRMVLCEVHFAVLEARGHKRGPQEIERFLAERGYSTRWVDASHLAAERHTSP